MKVKPEEVYKKKIKKCMDENDKQKYHDEIMERQITEKE